MFEYNKCLRTKIEKGGMKNKIILRGSYIIECWGDKGRGVVIGNIKVRVKKRYEESGMNENR